MRAASSCWSAVGRLVLRLLRVRAERDVRRHPSTQWTPIQWLMSMPLWALVLTVLNFSDFPPRFAFVFAHRGLRRIALTHPSRAHLHETIAKPESTASGGAGESFMEAAVQQAGTEPAGIDAKEVSGDDDATPAATQESASAETEGWFCLPVPQNKA